MAGRYPSRRCCTSFICLRFRERNLHERRRRRPSSGREKIFVLAQLISRCWRSKGEILIERERVRENTHIKWTSLFLCLRPSFVAVSVTRFGEISALWQKFYSLWEFFGMVFCLVFGKLLYPQVYANG